MTDYERRSWRIEEGDWVARRNRHRGPSLELPPPPVISDESGFVHRSFADRRAPPVAPVGGRVPSANPATTGAAEARENGEGGWVTLLGVPSDAMLEVREYMEAHYGPTRAMFRAPAPSAATAAFGAGSGPGSYAAAAAVGGGHPVAECFLCFERPLHAEQAVRTGALHFYVDRGASMLVAQERLATVFPEAAAAAGLGVVSPRRGSAGRGAHHHPHLGVDADVEDEDEEDSIASRLWVDVTVLWCPDQRILSALAEAESRSRALPSHRDRQPHHVQPELDGSSGPRAESQGLPTEDGSPTRRSATGLMDRTATGSSRGSSQEQTPPAAAQTAAAGTSGFVDTSAAAPQPSSLESSRRTAPGAGDGDGDGGAGSSRNSSVLGLFFASATHAHVWWHLPRLLLLMAWTATNLLSMSLFGRRPTGVHAPPSGDASAHPSGSSPSPLTSSLGSSTSSASSSSASASGGTDRSAVAAEYARLVHRYQDHHRRRRAEGGRLGSGARRRNPARALWRSLLSLSDGPSSSSTSVATSLSPVQLLSCAFYAALGSVAPAPSEVDLVLWSWLRLRSPRVQRNFQALRRRLRRLARAFSTGRDTTVGVYGNLDEPFDRYTLSFSPEALGWDGAFADLRMFDDDYYYGTSSYATTAVGSASTSARHEEQELRVKADAAASGKWLAGPPPLRVLLTWRPSNWVARYSVVSAMAVMALVLYTTLLREKEEDVTIVYA